MGKSLHHQVVLGPLNGSSDFHQKLGVAGPAAFGENTFWKLTPKTHILWKTGKPPIFGEQCCFVMPFYGFFVFSSRGGGALSKMYFRRRPPDRQPLAFGENPRTHLEAQGPLGDEVTYPECRKSWHLKILLFCETRSGARGSQKVAHHFPAHFRLVKTPSIAIWDNFVLFGGGGVLSAFSA